MVPPLLNVPNMGEEALRFVPKGSLRKPKCAAKKISSREYGMEYAKKKRSNGRGKQELQFFSVVNFDSNSYLRRDKYCNAQHLYLFFWENER